MLLCHIQHKTTLGPKDLHTPDMKYGTKIQEENTVKRNKRGKEGRVLQREQLWFLWWSQIADSLSLFKKKKKNTRVPHSLGTAATQILVLNDVRNMAFWRATACTRLWRLTLANAATGTETWHCLPLALVNTENRGKKILHALTADPLRRLIFPLLIPNCLGLKGKICF